MWWWIYVLASGIVASTFEWQVIVVWAIVNGIVGGFLSSYSHDLMAFLHSLSGDGDSWKLRELHWLKWMFVRSARFRYVAKQQQVDVEVAFFGLPMWTKWYSVFDKEDDAMAAINKQYYMLMRAAFHRGKQQRKVVNVRRPSAMEDM